MTDQRPLVAHYGRFGGVLTRHGGVRRSEQLLQILEANGIDVAPLVLASSRSQSPAARAKGVARGTTLMAIDELAHLRRPSGLYHLAMAHSTLRQVADPAVPIVWESGRGEASYGAKAARRRHHRVIAVPQALDSLNYGERSSWSGRRSPDWVEEELRQLRSADTVFVLTEPERWFLALHQIDAHVLPYHPPRQDEEDLMGIRLRRAARAEDGRFLLALGSLGAATAEIGLRALVELPELDEILAAHDLTIVIAGFGTDRLRPASGSQRLIFEGPVTDDRRDELLTAARALLVSAVPATGALTRIPEALVAGLPVIATRSAARGAEHHAGVDVYDDAASLAALLGELLPTPPPPERPVLAERRFVDRVLAAVAASARGRLTMKP